MPYPACLVCVQPKCKSNDHFEIVECSPTFRRCQIASFCAYRAICSTLIYRFYGGSECRGYHPEQVHQFHLRHPNITTWNIYIAIRVDSYNCSFHSYIAIEIFTKRLIKTITEHCQILVCFLGGNLRILLCRSNVRMPQYSADTLNGNTLAESKRSEPMAT